MKRISATMIYCAVLSFTLTHLASASDTHTAQEFIENRLGSQRQIDLQDLTIELPANWKWHQDAEDNGVLLMGFSNGENFVQMYAKEATNFDMKKVFVNGSTIIKEPSAQTYGGISWKVMETSHSYTDKNGQEKVYVTSFAFEKDGVSYYGFSRSTSSNEAAQNVEEILKGISFKSRNSLSPFSRSLTGKDYFGKKYYIGFGDHLSGFMGNEVKYDIKHTHDIFTEQWGGTYVGSKVNGSGQGASALRAKWKEVKAAMTFHDMYVQYSSGHGYASGLAFGVTYDEMRDYALSLPAKEVIVFIMACHAGGLVNSFDAKKATWQNWDLMGRTLFVFASSLVSQESSTGPGTDSDEPGGPSGSAGSAFGHSLWKALIGYSDGYMDGIKDGYISLGEIEHFTRMYTKKKWGHIPIATGNYSPFLIINRVPPKRFLESLPHSTEGMSDEEVNALIQQLDSEMRL